MSGPDATCNGWANYATWRVNLEILDDYITGTVYDDAETREAWLDLPTRSLGDLLEEYADDVVTGWGELSDDFDSTGALAVAYARAFLADADWFEIAEHAQALARDARRSADQRAAA